VKLGDKITALQQIVSPFGKVCLCHGYVSSIDRLMTDMLVY
jgi:hypothetical protein